MSAKQRLNAELEKAAAHRAAGAFEAARQVLATLVSDPDRAALGPETALGLPRRLHSALLKLAKAEHDPLQRIGYQYHLVPDPAVLAVHGTFTSAERRVIADANRASIPPVIHQVWIGNGPLPPSTKAWEQHARAHGYGYFLWREKDLEDAGVLENDAFRAMLERGDYPGAVDVARYLLLEQEGGIYLDCDWYPARLGISFHDLLPMTGLTAMAEEVPRKTGRGSLLLANSFLAAPAHHPILMRLNAVLPSAIAAMPDAPAWWSTGPLLFTVIARGGALTLADASLVAGELSRGAPFSDVEAACKSAEEKDAGLLLAWKSW
jgi:inositol phosphorylceramide mannosyltransferase catalytic subunit